MCITDQNERQQALDTKKSFIVQAPAGSGKTEILTQRFLALLAIVKTPESIIAITFTNKAKQEMKARVINALMMVKENNMPTDSHKQNTYNLAKKALDQDQKHNWQLLANPNRLSITTIDALSLKLTTAMPEHSGLLTKAKLSDDIEALYHRAIDMMLENFNKNHPKSYPKLLNLLNHLDNNLKAFYDLITRMLKSREQWLSYLINPDDQLRKNTLENNFTDLIKKNLKELCLYLDPFIPELEALSNYARDNLKMDFPNNHLSYDLESLAFWQFTIDHLLLTKDNKLKKRITKNEGFVVSDNKKNEKDDQKKQKEKIQQLLKDLERYEKIESIIELATDLKSITLNYHDDDWQILTDMIDILILSTQYLKLIFIKSNGVDFNEVVINAVNALGTDENPTDLMLYLDYKIEHLLVDEFQDTSKLQYELIKGLTRGWQNNDGKSLFLVGDPMQSIYRFRQAEVELFLNAKEGIGDIKLIPIYLQSNFRSNHTIVDWINQTFSGIFPKKDIKELGAISYRASKSSNKKNINSSISFICVENDTQEALHITKLIKEKQAFNPSIHIGILARSKIHLEMITYQLKDANIAYNENEIEPLYYQPIIEDLLSLLEVILSPLEAIGWSKLLTSRLFSINFDVIETVLKNLSKNNESSFIEELSDFLSNQKSMNHLNEKLKMIDIAISERFKKPLSTLLKNLWLSINGPNHYPINEHPIIENFFDLVSSYEDCGHLIDEKSFYQRLKSLRVSKLSDAKVDVMTIHKAKGLEFDLVILPGLNKGIMSNDNELLNYDYYHTHDNQFRLLLASKAHSWQKNKPHFYKLLNEIKKRRSDYEMQRLLYVAITRAKSAFYCFSSFDFNEPKATRRSFFSLLYPLTKDNWQKSQITVNNHKNNDQGFIPKRLQVISDIELLPLKNKQLPIDNTPDDFDFYELHGQIIGNIIHFLLEKLINQKAYKSAINQSYIDYLVQTQLHLYGLSNNDGTIKNLVIKALYNTLNNNQIKGFLTNAKSYFCEYSLYSMIDKPKEKVTQSIIDLLIINKDQSVVIIDYKTTHFREGHSIELFLKDEIKYHKKQILRYNHQIKNYFSAEKIKNFLYFPIIDQLCNL